MGPDESLAAAGGVVGSVLCRFADGRIVSPERVISVREAAPSVLSSRPSVSLGRGGWGEAFAVGAKLRRVGPMTTASGAYCIVEPWPSSGRGMGRSVCSCRRA